RVVVGEQDQVRPRQGGVVGHLAVRVDVEDRVLEGEHEGAVTEEGEVQRAGRGGDAVRGRPFGGRDRGRIGAQQQENKGQQGNDGHGVFLLRGQGAARPGATPCTPAG